MKPVKAANREAIHTWIHYGALVLLVISLPTSSFFISVSLEILAINWLAGGRIKEKFRIFLDNKPALAFSLIYISYLVFLLWTKDFSYALQRDLLHKSPTLFMPLILVSSPKLDAKKVYSLIFLFIATVFTVTLIGLTKKLIHPDISYREISPFMSGIYLGLMLIISATQLPILVKKLSGDKRHFYIALALSAWFIFFLFYIRALSGIASLAAVLIYLLFHNMKQWRSLLLKIAAISVFILLIFLTLWPIKDIYRLTQEEIPCNFETLEVYSEHGEAYIHDTTEIHRENGHLIYIHIAEKELAEAWNKKSDIDFYELDHRGWHIRFTLYRYMSSMGLKKDREGFNRLSDEDIRAVENSYTNYLDVDSPGVYTRLREEFAGLYYYRKSSYKDPSWSSLSQRVDLWRASLISLKEKPLFGWGTGSILQALGFGFESYGSPMGKLNLKPHNQFLYILLTQGIIGFLLVFGLYGYTIVRTGAWKIQMFRIFIIIFAINFLANNPLENQLGQNLFVFFFLYFCFLYPQKQDTEQTLT